MAVRTPRGLGRVRRGQQHQLRGVGLTRLCRWGKAEYETGPLEGLPASVVLVDDPASAEIVVVPSRQRVRAEDVPSARLVLTTTSGFDNLDVASLMDAGVTCARLPMARRDAVVETALGMMLALTRRFARYRPGAQAGRWERDRLAEIDARLLGTVGVVGAGVIGSRMVEVLQPLAPVLVHDPRLATSVPLAELLEACDVVTLHCALTPFNVGFIDPYAMRAGAVLINTARGRLIDAERALAAVRRGHLGGLGLDVFPTEPTDLRTFDHPDVLVTPHAAGWSPQLGRRIAEGVAEVVRAYLAGAPIPWTVQPWDR